MTAGWKVRKTSYTSALWYLSVERGSWYLACGAGRRGVSQTLRRKKEREREMLSKKKGVGLPRGR